MRAGRLGLSWETVALGSLKPLRHPDGLGFVAQFFVEVESGLVVGKDLEANLAIAPLRGPGFGLVDEGGADTLAAMAGVNVEQKNVGMAIARHLIHRIPQP